VSGLKSDVLGVVQGLECVACDENQVVNIAESDRRVMNADSWEVGEYKSITVLLFWLRLKLLTHAMF
jgi:hypothetical protein